MKKFFLSIVAICATYMVTASEVVTLTVNGQGATKEIATSNALRSAIEQAFGVFVSANTQILNDALVKDEIATVSSGNIQQYTEISCVNMPNGEVAVTLSATVAIGKLVAYAKSKGATAEFAGQAFAMNMKLKELNKQNEEKSLKHAQQQLRTLAEHMFDLRLRVGDPMLTQSGDYMLGMTITLVSNEASDAFYKTFYGILNSLSLNSSDMLEYNNANIPTYPVYIADSHQSDYGAPSVNTKTYSFRSEYIYSFIEDVHYILRAALIGFKVIETNNTNYFYSFFERPKSEIFDELPKKVKGMAQLENYIGFNFDAHIPEYRGMKVRNFSNYKIRVVKKKKLPEPVIYKNDVLTHNVSIIVEKDRIGSIAGFEVVRDHKCRVDVEYLPHKTINLGDGRYICKYNPRYRLTNTRHHILKVEPGIYLTDKHCIDRERLPYESIYRYSANCIIAKSGHEKYILDNQLNYVLNLEIPEGVTSIRNSAFSGCSALKSVTIPNSVTKIGKAAFYGCESLTSVTIGNGVTSIGSSAFSGCSALKSVAIPNGVTSIEAYTFSDCSALKCVTIPEGVTSIGSHAFYGCTSLTSVTIPESVTLIEEYAFFNNYYILKSVYCKSTTPPILGIEAFPQTDYNLRIYVPRASIEIYKKKWRTWFSDNIKGGDF